nr:hypothetical protein [uncultured bacterium]
MVSVMANPSIPSIKLIALTKTKKTKTVKSWAAKRGISCNPKTPWKWSMIKPWSINIFATITCNRNFSLKSAL